MDGATFHERLRILLHDKGMGYVIPHPFWTPEELTTRAQAALEVLYSTLIEKSLSSGKPCVVINSMIRSCTATAGTAVPSDYYKAIIGRTASGQYVNADPMTIAAADVGFDTVWAAGGRFKGTADTVYYYAQPLGPMSPESVDMRYFPEGFYDAVITLAAIETVMSEQQDGADRLDVLYEIFQDQIETLQ